MTEITALHNLEGIVRNDLAELYHGIGTISSRFGTICSDIKAVVTSFLEEPEKLDLSAEPCINFLKSTLPSLCEVIFRRKTKM